MSFLVWWCHIRDRLTPLNYEQCGAHMWARLSGACSHLLNYTRWIQDIVGRVWSWTMVGNVAEFEQDQNRCCQLHGRQTESSYCCIQPAPSQEDGTASLCFILITTCNILYCVFEFTICFLYHLQLNFTHVPVWPHSGCMRNAPVALQMQYLRASSCKCFICALYCICILFMV